MMSDNLWQCVHCNGTLPVLSDKIKFCPFCGKDTKILKDTTCFADVHREQHPQLAQPLTSDSKGVTDDFTLLKAEDAATEADHPRTPVKLVSCGYAIKFYLGWSTV